MKNNYKKYLKENYKIEFNNLYKLSYTDYLKDKELRKKSIEEGYTYAKLYINYSTVKE